MNINANYHQKATVFKYHIDYTLYHVFKNDIKTFFTSKSKRMEKSFSSQVTHSADDNSQLNSTSCSHPNYKFKYEWEGKLYHSGDYAKLIQQFRTKVRNVDSANNIATSIRIRLEQVNHLSYLRTCFQRMADNTVGKCLSYHIHHGNTVQDEIRVLENRAQQLKQILLENQRQSFQLFARQFLVPLDVVKFVKTYLVTHNKPKQKL